MFLLYICRKIRKMNIPKPVLYKKIDKESFNDAFKKACEIAHEKTLLKMSKQDKAFIEQF